MKTLFFALFVVSSPSFAQELTIGNAFQVDQDGQVFRGREPKKLVTELAAIGITDVIIFKNDVRGEVEEEKKALKELKITSHHIPFRWKDYPSLIEACEQTIEALQIIRRVKKEQGKVFFHCTAGEDRTGALAGLYRMLSEGISQEEAFTKEMCERGYSDGNPKKPALVTGAIIKELTPLFVAMAAKVEAKETSLEKITKRFCEGLTFQPTTLKCRN